MNVKYLVKWVIVVSLLTGVASAEDGLTPGAGIFSGDKGEFSLLKVLKKNKTEDKTEQSKQQSVTERNANTLVTAQLSEHEKFQLFQEWRKLQAANSDEYQEFKQWLEYQAFINRAKKVQ